MYYALRGALVVLLPLTLAGPWRHRAVVFLGETPRLYHLGGIAFIAAGLVLASTRSGRARARGARGASRIVNAQRRC